MLIKEYNKRIVIIAPLSALSKRLRLFKLSKFLNRNADATIMHIGWERVEGEAVENELSFDIRKKIILKGGGYGGTRIKYMYFLWMVKVFFNALFLKKSDVVWALGFESAFPALLASKIVGFKVLFDDADRFSLLFNFPTPVNLILTSLERYTSRKVKLHIIPGVERYDFVSDKFYLIKNTPSENELLDAKEIYHQREWPLAKILININGWLGEGRGISIALDLCKRLLPYDIKFILAGKIACSDAQELSELSNVIYLGRVSNAEALASYYASDFVFTYYDPSSTINQLAESNKWGDAIKTGVGVIVNKEVKTAEYLRKAQATLSCNYHDVEKLADLILELYDNEEKMKMLKSNISSLSNEFGFYEEQLAILFGFELKKQVTIF